VSSYSYITCPHNAICVLILLIYVCFYSYKCVFILVYTSAQLVYTSAHILVYTHIYTSIYTHTSAQLVYTSAHILYTCVDTTVYKRSYWYIYMCLYCHMRVRTQVLPDVYIYTDHQKGASAGLSPGYAIRSPLMPYADICRHMLTYADERRPIARLRYQVLFFFGAASLPPFFSCLHNRRRRS